MYLTKNELEIMDVLWQEGRALSRGEILSLSMDKSWMDSSVHILLNSMLKKGALREAGFIKCGKTCGRVYEATLSAAEYHVSTLDAMRNPPGLEELFAAYLAAEEPDDAALAAVEKRLKAEKARRKALAAQG
ncbi:MAG: BlaI/MecI/CopY family transcriptional regulator [Oscillospiraceae bacterium]|nr:BlaI/MecI/CopY family transcriptional regulator [Oscillospiraceae bacterium]